MDKKKLIELLEQNLIPQMDIVASFTPVISSDSIEKTAEIILQGIKDDMTLTEQEASDFIGFTMYDLFEYGYLNEKGADFINNHQGKSIKLVNEPFFKEVSDSVQDLINHKVDGETYP